MIKLKNSLLYLAIIFWKFKIWSSFNPGWGKFKNDRNKTSWL